MYLRRCYRHKDGKRHAYWALVESYRTARGPRQRVAAWLGVMDEQGRLGVKHCAERATSHQGHLFRDTEPRRRGERKAAGARGRRGRKGGGELLRAGSDRWERRISGFST